MSAAAGNATPWYRSSRTWLKLGLSVSVTGLLLYLLITNTKQEFMQLAVPELHPLPLLAALGAYLVVVLSRAVRFRLIHRELRSSTMGQWIQVAVIHAALNQVLPFRAGETSYPYLMHRIHGVTVGRSLLVLLSARILDLMSTFLYCIFFVFLLAPGSLQTERSLFVLVAAGVVAVCVLSLVAMRPAIRLLHRLTRRMKTEDGDAWGDRFRRALKQRAERLVAEAEMFRDFRHFASIFLVSATLWLALFVTFWGLMNGFGFSVSLPAAVIGSVGAAMMNILPVSGVANFGTQEAGWTLGLMLAGLSHDAGLAAGVWAHLGNMCLALLLGLAGYVWMRRSRPAPPLG